MNQRKMEKTFLDYLNIIQEIFIYIVHKNDVRNLPCHTCLVNVRCLDDIADVRKHSPYKKVIVRNRCSLLRKISIANTDFGSSGYIRNAKAK